MQTVITRKAAHVAGLAHFYTGKPCCNGHDAPRFVSNGGCVTCNKERMAAFNKSIRQTRTARLQGLFTYQLHPDDREKALAFCQALDMDRGRAPQVPVVAPLPPMMTPEEVERVRQQIFHQLAPAEPPPFIPKL